MTAQDINNQVERLASLLVLADPTDLPGLADLHTRFESIARGAGDEGRETLVEAAKAAANLVEKVVLGEVPDPAAALDVVGRTVSAIQAVVRDERPVAEANFPAELGLTSAPSSPSRLPTESNDSAATQDGSSEPDQGAGAEAAAVQSCPLEGDVTLLSEFVTEATEHLENADVHLLTLESNAQDDEALNAVFRAFHTIKGVGGFLGLREIQALAHEAENLLDGARKGQLLLSGTAMDVTFEAVDALKQLVAAVRRAVETGGMLEGLPGLADLVARIQVTASGSGPPAQTTPVAPNKKLGELLMESGKVAPQALESALLRQQQGAMPRKIGELVAETNAVSRAQVERALTLQTQDPEHPPLGEVLMKSFGVEAREVETALQHQQAPRVPKVGELLVKQGAVAAKDVAQALRSQKGAGPQGPVAQIKEAVKVDADRLDRLVDTIGELVIAESMISQSAELRGMASPQLAAHLRQMDKITRELQEMATSLRMVPIRGAFQKMARVVHDLAKKSGKRVEFRTAGEDTELDKTVVDRIGDPLVHMVRNAVDHGVEATPEDREKAGKPAHATVELRAFHKGGSIYIEIEDDGRGIDRDAILAKAQARGLIRDGEMLTDREIFNLIFEPGLSTAKTVTEVSGRGVGMDVVKRNIEALRGQVEIQSEHGKGSVFSIRLPLTLAIIDGMVVRVGGERYIVPTLSIVRTIRPQERQLRTVLDRGEMLSLHDRLIPLFRLDRLFDIKGAERDPARALAVIVEDDGKQAGLLADELLGQQQIVIKSLGDYMKGSPGVSGGAIMPDGHVGLILDVSGLVRLANAETREGHPAAAALQDGMQEVAVATS